MNIVASISERTGIWSTKPSSYISWWIDYHAKQHNFSQDLLHNAYASRSM